MSPADHGPMTEQELKGLKDLADEIAATMNTPGWKILLGQFEIKRRHLLEALAGSRARIVVVTSCEVYGAPAPETHRRAASAPCRPDGGRRAARRR